MLDTDAQRDTMLRALDTAKSRLKAAQTAQRHCECNDAVKAGLRDVRAAERAIIDAHRAG